MFRFGGWRGGGGDKGPSAGASGKRSGARGAASRGSKEKDEDDLSSFMTGGNISDKDVHGDLSALMGELGMSPDHFGADSGDDDESAILRELGIKDLNDHAQGGDVLSELGLHSVHNLDALGAVDESSVEVTDDDLRDPALLKELRGLGYVPSPRASERKPQPPRDQRSELEKLQEELLEKKKRAVALSRSGNKMEAVAVLRETRVLEERIAAIQSQRAQPPPPPPSSAVSAVDAYQQALHGEDEPEVTLTEADMRDPELLGELQKIGYTPEDRQQQSAERPGGRAAQPQPPAPAVGSAEALQAQIMELKKQAVQLKRQGRNDEALACMRRVKQLEGGQSSQQAPSPPVEAKAEPKPVSNVSARIEELQSLLHAEKARTDELRAKGDIKGALASINKWKAMREELMAILNGAPAGSEQTRPSTVSAPAAVAVVTREETEVHQSFSFVATSVGVVTPSTPPAPMRVIDAIAVQGRDRTMSEELEDEFDNSAGEEDEEGGHGLHPQASKPPTPPAVAPPSPPTLSVDDEIRELQRKAVALKKEGRVQEAIQLMKEIKQLEQRRGQPRDAGVTAAVAAPQQKYWDQFLDLEKKLVDFANRTNAWAKEWAAKNRAVAAELVEVRKTYSEQLQLLREARKNPHQPPPSYSVQVKSIPVEVRLDYIPADQLEFHVLAIEGAHHCTEKYLYVDFDLGFPSDQRHTGRTAVIAGGPDFVFNFVQRFPLKRSSSTRRTFDIRKANFEVYRSRLLGQDLVGRASIELKPLLSRCEVSATLPLVDGRKQVGGSLKVCFRMQSPLQEKEMKLQQFEYLAVSPYPPAEVRPSLSSPDAGLVLSPAPTAAAPSAPRPAAAPAVAPAKSKAAPAAVPQNELAEPDAVALLVSYDVILAEIEAADKILGSNPGNEEVSFRKEILQSRKEMMELEIETGRLEMEAYLQRLEKRIAADKALALALQKQGSKPEAMKVMKRVKIMESEIATAREGQ